MLEFLPWSKNVLTSCLEKYKNTRRLCIIDVELGGYCNFKCLYCDTPKYQEGITYSVERLEQLILQSDVEWLFLCGLGEPTCGPNLPIFKRLLSFCHKNDIKCSVFTNASLFDDELFEFIDNDTLYPLFKLDSFMYTVSSEVYGISDDTANEQINMAKRMVDHVKCVGGCTNICASIVPSKFNVNELIHIVDWCYENNIFPLIGDLEDAGKGQQQYNELKLNNNDLLLLKEHILKTTGMDYSIPICPSVLFGLHVDHNGKIVVDKKTGLSCHWFWLTEPKIDVLSDINDKSFDELSEIVIINRKKHIDEMKSVLSNMKRLIFGGCGGDIVDLFGFYLDNMC